MTTDPQPQSGDADGLRQKLRALPRPAEGDYRYPIDAYEDDLVALIERERLKARIEVLKHSYIDQDEIYVKHSRGFAKQYTYIKQLTAELAKMEESR